MTQKPLVTAVITTYERPELVKRAIKSVLNQTYDPLQIVVVEDGSESGVDKWIDEHGLDKVSYICHEKNMNGAAARNTGIEAANGKYIGFLDDDDEWKPQFIERLTKKAENLTEEQWRSLGVVYAALETKHPDGSTQVNYPKNEGNLKESIMEVGAKTLDSSLFFPKRVLEKVGGWDETLPSGNVHDMWMTLAINDYEALPVDEPLVVKHHDNRDRMTTNPDVRIPGVRMYVEKWKPTYREWFGEKEGNRYADQYFARVIARLVGEKIKQREIKEASHATRAIIEYSDQHKYNLFIISNTVVKNIIIQYFPEKAVATLRYFKRLVVD